MSSAFSLSLSPLVGGSKQFIVTLEEGQNTQIPPDVLCDTASRSDVGVATALTLLSYEQVPPVAGVSLIKAGQSQTGNAGVIAIGGSALESYAGSSGYSTGASTVVIASSGNGEAAALTYDTSTLAAGSLSAHDGEFSVAYISVATEADLEGVSFTTAISSAGIVIADIAADPSPVWRICVRKNSALYATILSNYLETADEDCMRLLFAYNQNINVKFASVDYPTPYEFTPGFAANAGIWTAFLVSSSTPDNAAGGVNRLIFGSTTPASGAFSTAQLKTIRHESTKRRCVKCVFNATAIVSESQSRYGGGIATR